MAAVVLGVTLPGTAAAGDHTWDKTVPDGGDLGGDARINGVTASEAAFHDAGIGGYVFSATFELDVGSPPPTLAGAFWFIDVYCEGSPANYREAHSGDNHNTIEFEADCEELYQEGSWIRRVEFHQRYFCNPFHCWNNNNYIFDEQAAGPPPAPDGDPPGSPGGSVCLSGTPLSGPEVTQVLWDAGFRGNRLLEGLAITAAESGWDPFATNTVGNVAGVDRGLWQINSFFHPQVSASQAFDPAFASEYAFQISSGGQNWQLWVVYNTGAYLQYMHQARAAYDEWLAIQEEVSWTPGINPCGAPPVGDLDGDFDDVEDEPGFPHSEQDADLSTDASGGILDFVRNFWDNVAGLFQPSQDTVSAWGDVSDLFEDIVPFRWWGDLQGDIYWWENGCRGEALDQVDDSGTTAQCAQLASTSPSDLAGAGITITTRLPGGGEVINHHSILPPPAFWGDEEWIEANYPWDAQLRQYRLAFGIFVWGGLIAGVLIYIWWRLAPLVGASK